PTAGRADALQFEVGLALPAVLQRPTAVVASCAAHELDRLGQARVARRADGLEMVKGAEDVVVPARGKRESDKFRLDDFARAVGAEEPVHEKELAAAALSVPHLLP